MKSDTLMTVFHSSRRRLCCLAATDGIKIRKYLNLLAEAMGIAAPADEYAQWKNAGSEAAITEQIGPERIAKIGRKFFAAEVLQELCRLPEEQITGVSRITIFRRS